LPAGLILPKIQPEETNANHPPASRRFGERGFFRDLLSWFYLGDVQERWAALDLVVLVSGSGGYRFTFVNKSHFSREASGEEMRLEVVRGRARSRFSLLVGGLAPKILQKILGRARITLTLHSYSYVLPDTQEGGVEAFTRY
jgi:hypothetical protein